MWSAAPATGAGCTHCVRHEDMSGGAEVIVTVDGPRDAHNTGGWVGPRSGLDVAKRRCLWPLPECETRTGLVTVLTELLRIH
jgi:hypothetical protein